jgi:DNA-binding NtrC family response regulator
MTFGVIERKHSFLAKMMALVCKSAGHQCFVFKDVAHVTSILHAVRLDTLLLDVERPGLNALDWLEIMLPAWPELPSRTLLLKGPELGGDTMDRIRQLGVEVAPRPRSVVDVKIVVMEREQRARTARSVKRFEEPGEQLLESRRRSAMVPGLIGYGLAAG